MADDIEKTPIPDTPPAGFKSPPVVMKSIAAVKAACIAAGLKSKIAQCAILGNIAVESRFIPQDEQMYTTKNLLKLGVSQADAEKYGRPGISREEHFGFRYGVLGRRNGYTLADANYYGRGLIQLTGKKQYVDIGKICGIDLVGNPGQMSGTDSATVDICAKVVVAFFIYKFKMFKIDWEKEQWKPAFLERCIKMVGGSADGTPGKRAAYEYFYGGKASAPSSDKDPSNTTLNKSAKDIDSAPVNKREAYSEDRSANFNKNGFADPEGKYPLRDYMNEPDTNRLARGILEGTHVNFKDATRMTNIPIANTEMTWDQPISSYNTVYPYNKVFESESGHVLEFDDSLNGERINLYHKKGTFIEIDPNGSQINYIVGDGFYITEQNGNVYINGTCNITVASDLNILCKGHANIEVDGTTNIVAHENLNIGVAKDMNVAVGGDYNVLVEGNYNVEVGKTSNTRSIGTMSIEATDALKLKTAKTMSMEGGDTASTAETLMKMSSSFKLETPADFQIKAKTFTLDIETATEIKTKTLLVEVEDTTKIKTKSFQLDTKTDTKIKTDKFQLDGTTSTDILTGMFNTTTTMGVLQLNSLATAVINAPTIIAMTSAKIDLNGTPIPPVPITTITAIEDKVEPLVLLGAPKVPVDFAGDPVKDRKEEQVLVDTVLNPAGVYNPFTLPKTLIDDVLGGIPVVGDMLKSFGGTTPDVYDVKYAGSPIENKTSLATAGKASPHRLVVPPVDCAYNQPFANLIPPQRSSSGEFKYEEESDWNSPGGQKYADKTYSTSAYEHNAIKNPTVESSIPSSGGAGAGTGLSAEKLAEINNQSGFPLGYKLSEHFTLGMLTLGGKYTVADANLPSAGSSDRRLYTKQTLVANLSALCENILEPIYKELGPCQGGGGGATWLITSGLRTEGAVKTSKASSDHNKGRAVDFQFIDNNSVDNLFALITKLEKALPYNKLIMEYKNNGNSRWIHCSYSTEGNAGQTYTYVEDKNTGSGLKKLFS